MGSVESEFQGRTALLCGRRRKHVSQLVARLEAGGGQIVALDPTDPDAARAQVKRVLEDGTPCHYLVLLDHDPALCFAMARLLLGRVLETGYGRVIFAALPRPLAAPAVEPFQLARELHRRLKEVGRSRQIRSLAAVGLPAVWHALSEPLAPGGGCYAPGRLLGLWGRPRQAAFPARAGGRRDEALWRALAEATGIQRDALDDERERAPQLRRELAQRPRRVSAMIRVKDEEEFLHPAVTSIAELVDEIVLIDNLSRDRTPEIIRALAAEHPGKVVSLEYPYPVARWGSENQASLGASATDAPRPIHAYQEWCLQRCTHPFVLKWDGDMLALDEFGAWMERWRASDALFLSFGGANVHPDRMHLLGGRAAGGSGVDLFGSLDGAWMHAQTMTLSEARIFPADGARYHSGAGSAEVLDHLLLLRPWREGLILTAELPCYLHLKYCKRDPLATVSPELERSIREDICVGPPMAPAYADTLRRYNLA